MFVVQIGPQALWGVQRVVVSSFSLGQINFTTQVYYMCQWSHGALWIISAFEVTGIWFGWIPLADSCWLGITS